MKKKLHCFLLVLITYNTFGVDKIWAPIPAHEVHKLIACELPQGFDPEIRIGKEFRDMHSIMQNIICQLNPEKAHKFSLKEFTEKKTFSSDKKYILFVDENLSSCQYCFEWKKKSYSQLKGLEKCVAHFYKANKSSNIEFLYPYKRADQELSSKIDNSPWAIRIGSDMHSLLWRDATIKDASNSMPDEFIKVTAKDLAMFDKIKIGFMRKTTAKVLVDENDKILAKYIHEDITYRETK